MPMPWLQNNASTGSGLIVSPPDYDRVLDFKSIKLHGFHQVSRRLAEALPPSTSSQLDSDPLNDFCEKHTFIDHSDRESCTEKFEVEPNVEDAVDNYKIVKNLKRLNVVKLNDVQRKCLGVIRSGRGILVEAPTGIGKTYAFIIPAIERVMKERSTSRTNSKLPSPYVLILANTNTLVQQIHSRLELVLGQKSMDNVEPINDVNVDMMKAQHQFTKDQCDIASCTMGKLKSTIESGEVCLDNLKMLIIDEADRMVDSGAFGFDIEWVLENLSENVRENLQTCFFSATYQKDRQNRTVLNSLQEKMLGDKPYSFVGCPRMPGYIKQRIIKIERPGHDISTSPYIVKMRNIIHLIEADLQRTQCRKEGPYKETIVIFCETVSRATQVTMTLRQLGYNFRPLHRTIAKNQQKINLSDLEFCKIQGLVCTNIMARGIDVSSVKHTIVMEMSNDFDTYRHRIGRVGRDGTGGVATVFIDQHELLDGRMAQIVDNLFVFMSNSGDEIPEWLKNWFDSRHSDILK